jgi:uncharacterized protein DUF2721
MFGVENEGSALDTIAHMIQVALTPVFLLTGIATLLNVFSTRLARVGDRVEAASKALDGADADARRILSAQLAHLHRQSVALNVAVILAGIGGAATCAAVLTLFVGALRDMTVASVLFGLFGLAVVCALGAIAAFVRGIDCGRYRPLGSIRQRFRPASPCQVPLVQVHRGDLGSGLASRALTARRAVTAGTL